MIIYHTRQAHYYYFKIFKNKFCIRVKFKFNKFSNDKRLIAFWRVK